MMLHFVSKTMDPLDPVPFLINSFSWLSIHLNLKLAQVSELLVSIFEVKHAMENLTSTPYEYMLLGDHALSREAQLCPHLLNLFFLLGLWLFNLTHVA